MSTINVLALDYGASSGIAIVGSFKEKKLSLKEVHRFENKNFDQSGILVWDIEHQINNLKLGIKKACHNFDISSIGIDTWGVDIVFLDTNNKLLFPPIFYRYFSSKNSLSSLEKIIDFKYLYGITGIQLLDINTLSQLAYLKENEIIDFDNIKTILFIPDYMTYKLNGNQSTEYTIASTSGMLDVNTKDFAPKLLKAVQVENKFPKIIQPPYDSGYLSEDICNELKIDPIKVTKVCSHDTASAVVAVPTESDSFLYISSGTWSLMGIETDKPILEISNRNNIFTNEGGINNTIRYLKNIMGLWLIQETRRQWQREGYYYSFAELEKMAKSAPKNQFLIDPDNQIFEFPGNLPKRIIEFCKKTKQGKPANHSEIIRCIYDSLAYKYRMVKEQIEKNVNQKYEIIHVVGGGTKDELLLQLTADFTGATVISGPTEATAIGNCLVQLMNLGQISNLKEARQIVKNSFPIKIFKPKHNSELETNYKKFKILLDY
ncbi:MAG: rhamnulokinase [Clostridiaceae bacterium]|nr:rhamnulokinase [Clostridiaceae bacterium]